MDQFTPILIAAILILVAYLSVLVSYHTMRSEYFGTKQKLAILIIAWVIPVIGPAIILSVLLQDNPLPKKPGIPLLNFIFLTWAFSKSSEADAPSSSGDVSTSFNTGPDAGDT